VAWWQKCTAGTSSGGALYLTVYPGLA
jgi:hypothetical protein